MVLTTSMAHLWLIVLLIIYGINICCVTSNGYNLRELLDDDAPSDPIIHDKNMLNLINYLSNLECRAYGRYTKSSILNQLGLFQSKPEKESTFFIPRVSYTKKDTQERRRPQYIITFYPPLHSIIIYLMGMDINSKEFDLTNTNNVVPKEIILTKHENKQIYVHGGIYNAVNTKLFYQGSRSKDIKSFLLDLETMIENVHKYHYELFTSDNLWQSPIKSLYFTGHSQGI